MSEALFQMVLIGFAGLLSALGTICVVLINIGIKALRGTRDEMEELNKTMHSLVPRVERNEKDIQKLWKSNARGK